MGEQGFTPELSDLSEQDRARFSQSEHQRGTPYTDEEIAQAEGIPAQSTTVGAEASGVAASKLELSADQQIAVAMNRQLERLAQATDDFERYKALDAMREVAADVARFAAGEGVPDRLAAHYPGWTPEMFRSFSEQLEQKIEEVEEAL